MSNKTLPIRSSNSIFDETSVYFFYESILLVCESQSKSYGDEKSLKSAAKSINSLAPFDFVYKDYENEMQNPKDNVFYFSAATDKPNSKKANTRIVKKWYRHLRNAFAHNYIRKEGEAYIFEDYYKNEETPLKKTMYAKVLSLDDFKCLVTEVKKNIK